ncbi:MAG TPA: hypothetical protein VFZ93_07190 [Albitalea sp.]
MADLHDPHDLHGRRRRRAAAAAVLLARSPAAAMTLDWDTLDAAPAWLGRPAGELDALACRVGAVLCAPAIRLWIDAARLGAARAAVGDGFLRALLAQPDLPHAPAAPRIPSATQVAPSLQAWGAAVLLATLVPALRGAVSAALPHPAPLAIDAEAAQALVDRTLALAAGPVNVEETTP